MLTRTQLSRPRPRPRPGPSRPRPGLSRPRPGPSRPRPRPRPRPSRPRPRTYKIVVKAKRTEAKENNTLVHILLLTSLALYCNVVRVRTLFSELISMTFP